MNASTVFIVDDDDAVRDSLSLLCETARLKAECHDSAESFLNAYRPDQPGCLVLDVRMGGISGPQLHAELGRRGSLLPIIYLTAHGDIPMTVRAMQAGAVDFLTKPVDGAALLERIGAALQRDRDLRWRQGALARRRQGLALLTLREREIMDLALAGHANKEIAKLLGISHRTVEIHRSHILGKMGVTSLPQLICLAAACGLLPGTDAQDASSATGSR